MQSSQGYPACPAPPPPASPTTSPSSPRPPRANATAPPQLRAQVPPQPSPFRLSRRRRQQAGQQGEQQQKEQQPSPELLQVVLRVPYDRELAGVFLPLRSSTETVRPLGTNCDAVPAWRIVHTESAASDSLPGGAATVRAIGKVGVTVSSSSPGGGGSGGSGGNAPRSLLPMGDTLPQAAAEGCSAGAAAAWARWTLPPVVQPCWATVAVYDRPALAPAPAPAQPAPPPGPTTTTTTPRNSPPLPATASVDGSADAPRPASNTTIPTATNASSAINTNTTGTTGGSRNSSSNALAPSPAQLPPVQRVRAYNITLQPLSDPAVFSHMSLMLRERSSPRTLLLCGFPAGVLRALAARRYGLVSAGLAGEDETGTGSGDAGGEGGGSAATAEQLAWVAATLAQAVRGNRDALRQLHEPAAAAELAAAAAAIAPNNTGSREEEEGPGPASARPSPPAPAPGGGSGRRLLQGGRSEVEDLEGASNATPPASPPVSQAGDLIANLTAGGIGGALGWGTAPTEHDGFEVPHEPGTGGSGQGRWLFLLYNLQYVEWCDPAGQQVVDGALLAGAQADSELVAASSDGAVLLQVYGNGTDAQGSSGPLVVGRALLAELASGAVAARGAVAGPVAGPEPEPAGGREQGSRLEEVGGGGDAGSAVSLLRQEMVEAFNPSTSSSIDSGNGTSSGEPEQARHALGAGGAAPNPAPAPPQPAPSARSGSGSAGTGCTGGSRIGYGEGGQLPTPDRQLTAVLLAPDGVTTARVRLDLYKDYRATVAAALLAAAECAAAAPAPLANSSNSVNQTRSSSTAPAGDNSTAAPESSARWPPPQPAAAGNASASNASATWLGTAARAPGSGWVLAGRPPPWSPLDACGACGPGSYSEEANATACLMCPPGSASGDIVNTACAPCGAGTYAFQWGSPVCRCACINPPFAM